MPELLRIRFCRSGAARTNFCMQIMYGGGVYKNYQETRFQIKSSTRYGFSAMSNQGAIGTSGDRGGSPRCKIASRVSETTPPHGKPTLRGGWKHLVDCVTNFFSGPGRLRSRRYLGSSYANWQSPTFFLLQKGREPRGKTNHLTPTSVRECWLARSAPLARLERA